MTSWDQPRIPVQPPVPKYVATWDRAGHDGLAPGPPLAVRRAGLRHPHAPPGLARQPRGVVEAVLELHRRHVTQVPEQRRPQLRADDDLPNRVLAPPGLQIL